MQKCVGCGADAKRHPMVGIGREDLDANAGQMVDHPVCESCWKDPTHRTRALKLTFFPAGQSPVAVAAARVMDEKSKAGEDMTVGG